MTPDEELAALLDESRPRHKTSPHAWLIHNHNRELGIDNYDRERFMRLCAAWNETPSEMGARIGLDANTLRKRLNAGRFGIWGSYAECILLHQFERFIEWHHTGAERPTELFVPPK